MTRSSGGWLPLLAAFLSTPYYPSLGWEFLPRMATAEGERDPRKQRRRKVGKHLASYECEKRWLSHFFTRPFRLKSACGDGNGGKKELFFHCPVLLSLGPRIAQVSR